MKQFKQLKIFEDIYRSERGYKMKRTKIELKPALKAQDYKEGQVVKEQAFIKEVVEVETKFGDKTILSFDDGDAIFMNSMSNNGLIDAYGDEDSLWTGKPVKIVCEMDLVFKKLYLVAKPLLSTKI